MGFQSIEIAKKVFVIFDNVFHAYLMSGLKKNAIFFSQWLFLKIHFIRFEMQMDSPDKS